MPGLSIDCRGLVMESAKDLTLVAWGGGAMYVMTDHLVSTERANTGAPTPIEVNRRHGAWAGRVIRDMQNEAQVKAAGRLNTLAMLAIDIALEAALDRPEQPGYFTYVNRDTVREIRAVLDSAGIDWKTQRKAIKGKSS